MSAVQADLLSALSYVVSRCRGLDNRLANRLLEEAARRYRDGWAAGLTAAVNSVVADADHGPFGATVEGWEWYARTLPGVALPYDA